MGLVERGQVMPTTPSVQERILQNVRATLESVVAGVGAALPDLRNQNADASMVSSGTYTGTGVRLWNALVTTGGASGAAQITFTENSPLRSDHEAPVVQTVTSSVPFTVGTEGLQVTVTFTGNLVAGDKWSVRLGPYETTIARVWRFKGQAVNMNAFPGILMTPPTVSKALGAPSTIQTRHMTLTIPCELWLQNIDLEPEVALDPYMADLETAFMRDSQRGELAYESAITNISYIGGVEGRPYVGAEFDIEVQTQHAWDNPRVVIQ